jgi:osomolarity two-component system response regulator SKN7
MNDVLPKPFTKEGLLSMLDKHLSHLKKHHGGSLDTMGPPFNNNPVKRIVKGEDSPGASSTNNSNWNSPGGMAGNSPANNNLNDDPFLNPSSASGYNASGLSSSVPPHMFAPAPQVQLSMPQRAPQQQQQQQSAQPHRRNISDISGGQMDMNNDPKRQQMYAPGQPMPQMLQRPQQ